MRRTGHDTALESRPPSLVARFAIVTALCLGAGAATILFFTRQLDLRQAEKHAAESAASYATGLLSRDLRPGDLGSRTTPARRAALDKLLAPRMRADGTVRLALARPDGVITYSTERGEIGRSVTELARFREAAGGTITSRTQSIQASAGSRTKVLRSFVPVTVDGQPGVARIDKDYGPIASAARESFLPVAGILEAVLVVIYALLLPVLIRASRRIQRQMEHIHHQASYDQLTGLPNRRLFLERLDAELGSADARPVVVMLIDVDRFGQVNDTLGHDSGDRFLQELGRRLLDTVGHGAFLARFEGDEFGILQPGGSLEDARDLAGWIRADLAEPLLVDDIPLDGDVSIGIALHPEHGADTTTLLRHADVALRLAKESHTSVRVYEEGMSVVDRDQLALLPELRRAIHERELFLDYQPKANLQTGTINGAEALVRWQHPERGRLLPAAFVPYTETTGLGRDLSRYVLETAIRDLSMLAELGLQIPIAVNLSALDLLDTSLPRDLDVLLERQGVSPHLLELEITETAVMTDHARARTVIGELGKVGTRLAVDDFGTGYSSLSYLTSLPVDTIKIDMSFVQRMLDHESDAAIVRSVVELGHSLGLNVVAEGVETKELWQALQEIGCDTAQGFYFAEPRSLDTLLARLLSTQAVAEPRRDNVLKAEFGANGSSVRAV
jgi:diguanylate cyclase (GGDEF)-like protein